MIIVTTIAGVFLALAALAAAVRIVVGPTVADRMVALDTLLFIGVGALGTYITRTGDTTYIPVLVVAVVTAFVSTVVVARYIEAETNQR
jgi:multicomponent Na+:H+ antiporter subunit F